MIGGPDQPGADGQGASKSDTLDYVHDIIRELKQLADKAGYDPVGDPRGCPGGGSGAKR